MKYNITKYEPAKTSPKVRYVLGTDGLKPMVVIGLNPNRADKLHADPTIRRVMGFATRYGCDSFLMLNLYPQRVKDPPDLHKRCNMNLFQENLRQVKLMLKTLNSVPVLAAWGADIERRTYLKKSLKELYTLFSDNNVKWLKIGDKLTKRGHPRHPVRAPYLQLTSFDIEGYCLTL